MQNLGTHAPRFDREIHIDAHVAALPAGATAKGLFLRDPLQRVATAAPGTDLFQLAKVPKRRILPFFDYPYDELMRLLHAAAGVLWPKLPRGEGLRRLGHGAYEALIGHQVGRVIFMVVGNDFSRVAQVGRRGWQVSVSFGKVDYQELGPGHGAYFFKDFPAFLETYQVGVLEGAMRVFRVNGAVSVKLDGLGDGVIEMKW
ncbi:MAG: DUF2378 family protein [Deltaproteobacteria bacterium]|nr:DUF2378 family protein [Kofleriaceae bacterium]